MLKNFPLLITLFIFGTSFYSSAQITFQKTFEGTVYVFVKQTADDGYMLIGNISQSGVPKASLIKTDSAGDTLWTKIIGLDSSQYFEVTAAQQTNDNGYIIAGKSQLSSLQTIRAFLIKVNSIGDTVWAKYYGDVSTHDLVTYWVEQTNDGGYIITGSSNVSTLEDNLFILKTDSAGSVLWQRAYGGSDDEEGSCVKQTNDGGYIVAGFTRSFGSGASDAYLIKTDSHGDTLWSKTYGGSDAEYALSVLQTNDGGYLFTGHTLTFGGGGTTDIYLIKTDSTGNLLWTKTFGSINLDYAKDLKQTADGELIIAGYTRVASNDYDIYLISTDSTGTILWTTTIGSTGVDECNSIAQTNDGGYILISQNIFSVAGGGGYLIKTDSLGNSGCNQATITTATAIPPMQTINPATAISFPVIASMPGSMNVSRGCTVNNLCYSMGMVESGTDNSIEISPSPCTTHFKILLNHEIKHGSVKIYNTIGAIVIEESISNEFKKDICVNNLSDGIYFVTVLDGEKNYTRKLVVE